MKKLRVLFVQDQYTDQEAVSAETIAEYALDRDPESGSLFSLGTPKEVDLPSGERISIVCEVTRYGNYLSAYHDDKRICGLKASGNIDLALRLPSGVEFSLELVT